MGWLIVAWQAQQEGINWVLLPHGIPYSDGPVDWR